jgi:hypothetical protein
LAETWLLENIGERNTFLYAYDIAGDTSLSGDNPVRQLMASRLLAAISVERMEIRERHRRNLSYVMSEWYRTTPSGLGYVEFDGASRLGANAMALRLLVASPFREEYAAQSRALADGIISLSRNSGALRAWFAEPNYDWDEMYLLTFYSGEAILALLEYSEQSGDDAYLSIAKRIQEYYMREYVDGIENTFYPAYVPWHSMSLAHLFKRFHDEQYAAAVFRLTDKLLQIQDTTSFIGRFYDPARPELGTPHAASDAVYTEGLVHAYGVARLVGDSVRVGRYQQSLHLAFQNLMRLQVNAKEGSRGGNPERATGAILSRAGSAVARIDNVQHALDAYRALFEEIGIVPPNRVNDVGGSTER